MCDLQVMLYSNLLKVNELQRKKGVPSMSFMACFRSGHQMTEDAGNYDEPTIELCFNSTRLCVTSLSSVISHWLFWLHNQ